nr:immunoglobulin light chain junction region [Macaca mulatta]
CQVWDISSDHGLC